MKGQAEVLAEQARSLPVDLAMQFSLVFPIYKEYKRQFNLQAAAEIHLYRIDFETLH